MFLPRLAACALALCAAAAGQDRCEELQKVAGPKAAVVSAQMVAAKEDGSKATPEHCRVVSILRPSSDSHIEMELWLPAKWNRKFQAVGNGGWAGRITYADGGSSAVRSSMEFALQAGYATASTDTGHKASESPGASFALGHPEKLIDYGYRAVHEMTAHSKVLIAAFYGAGPRLSYWNSCSNGGRQGLMEAQRYPGDFDGIVAGAPASNWTGRATGSLWVHRAAHRSEAAFLPASKLKLIHDAVIARCDALDGVSDGVLEDPPRCKFDPGSMQCSGEDAQSCLTPAQVETARAIYTPAVDPRSGREIYAGLPPGSELGWGIYAGPRPFATGDDHYRYVVFQDAAWNVAKLDFAAHAGLAEKADQGIINALNPDLSAFFARGGKLLQYHGWSDAQIPAAHSVAYYKSVLGALGGASKVNESYRLFLVPGMGHCGGGAGVTSFDALQAVEEWVEKGQAPRRIVASRVVNGAAVRTRPLCPFPQVAVYGGGDPNLAASFACK